MKRDQASQIEKINFQNEDNNKRVEEKIIVGVKEIFQKPVLGKKNRPSSRQSRYRFQQETSLTSLERERHVSVDLKGFAYLGDYIDISERLVGRGQPSSQQ